MTLLLLFQACAPPSPPSAPPQAPEPATVVSPPEAFPTTYVLDFADRHRARVHIHSTFVCDDDVMSLWMANWTPGHYRIRDYVRYIESLSAHQSSGRIASARTAKNRWSVRCDVGKPVSVTYTVRLDEQPVRAGIVGSDFSVLNPAAFFVFPEAYADRPLHVSLINTDERHSVETTLDPAKTEIATGWWAANAETLIDRPIAIGQPTIREFDVGGVSHRLATFGQAEHWDHDLAASDLAAVVRTIADFWGDMPYDRYLFINLVLPGEFGVGGLEHRDSTILMTGRLTNVDDASHRQWVSLAAHEHFHTWNVKRLRPDALVAFDLNTEVHTDLLWFAEGLTSYYHDLLPTRAGVFDQDAFFTEWNDTVHRVQHAPGRHIQTVAASSFDTWTREDPWHPSAPNTQISYYRKGALIGWLLDAEIRRSTEDRQSLDDMMRRLYRSAHNGTYTMQDIVDAASHTAERDLDAFFDRLLHTTDDIDFGGALQWWGLRWAPSNDTDDVAFGAPWKEHDGRLVVTQVLDGTPAAKAGIRANDELIALDGVRLSAQNIDAVLSAVGANRRVPLVVARWGNVRTIDVTLTKDTTPSWTVEPDPNASPLAKRRYARWLASPREN